MNSCFIALILVLFVTSSKGNPCDSVEGNWYNQLGSELILTQIANGQLIGEFRTAVERTNGAAGKTYAIVRGILEPHVFGQLIGFSAVFNGGSSVTGWAGQCSKCGDTEVLHTTWVLKGHHDSCADNWKAVTINEDIFTRHPTVSGPRKEEGIHVPRRVEDTEEDGSLEVTDYYTLQSKLIGKWYTKDGLNVEINNVSNGVIGGELFKGESKLMTVTGNIDLWNADSTFSLAGFRTDLNAIDVIVGQHHHCENGKEVLEASNLRRRVSSICEDDVHEMTGYRRISFTRTPPLKNSENGRWFSSFTNKVSNFFSSMIGN